MKALIALLTGLSLLSGCTNLIGNNRDGPLPFPWLKAGNRFVYNFHPVSDTLTLGGIRFGDTEGALVITIRGESPNFELDHELAWTQGIPGELFPSTYNIEGFLTSSGLENAANRDCKDKLGLLRFHYARVPARPQLNHEYPQYACGKEVNEVLQVAAVKNTIRVKAGSFSTFVLHSQQDGWREYWSEADGPIKIELYEPDGDLLGYYELASREIAKELM